MRANDAGERGDGAGAFDGRAPGVAKGLQVLHLAVGITNSAPLPIDPGQRCMTALYLV